MAVGEIQEGLPHPLHRVEDVHRALHDVGEILPADTAEIRLAAGVEAHPFDGEMEYDRSPQHRQRRPDRAGDGLDERGLAAARLAGEAVDLPAPNLEADP